MQVLSKPMGLLGNMQKAIFDGSGLRMQPHCLVALRDVSRHRMQAFAHQLLDQLSAGGLVLNQDDVRMEPSGIALALLVSSRVVHVQES